MDLLKNSTDRLSQNSLESVAQAINVLPQQPLTGVSQMVVQLINEDVNLKQNLTLGETEFLGQMSNKVHSAYSIPIIYLPILDQHRLFSGLPEFHFEEKIQGYVNYSEGKFYISEFAVQKSWENFYELAVSVVGVLGDNHSKESFMESFIQLINSRDFKKSAKLYRETFRKVTLKFNRNNFVVKDYRVELYSEMQDIFERILIENNLERDKLDIIRSKLSYKGNV